MCLAGVLIFSPKRTTQRVVESGSRLLHFSDGTSGVAGQPLKCRFCSDKVSGRFEEAGNIASSLFSELVSILQRILEASILLCHTESVVFSNVPCFTPISLQHDAVLSSSNLQPRVWLEGCKGT
jgi:hypothetical protein